MAPALPLLLLLLFLIAGASAEPPASERAALLAFLSSIPHSPRIVWPSNSSACSWVGVTCDASAGSVIALRLPAAGLSGGLPTNYLAQLPSLRVISLHSNRISGNLSSDLFVSLPHLHAIYLQDNALAGSIPPEIAGLRGLNRLDLAGNQLSGTLPAVTFRASLSAFNVSGNRLNGSVPPSLARFPASSFAGNLDLCGAPLPPCSSSALPPSPSPATAGADGGGAGGGNGGVGQRHLLSAGAIVGIVAGAIVALAALLVLLFFLVRRRRRAGHRSDVEKAAATKRGVAPATPVSTTAPSSSGKEPSSSTAVDTAVEAGQLVFVSGGRGGDSEYNFDLEDLMRASAEMLGRGSLGTSYKATMQGGGSVVVKRLRDVVAPAGEFEAAMAALGGVRHRNLLTVRAYYYSKDEKLIVVDYVADGSLGALLHGSRGGGSRTPMSWEARLRAALCAARGLAHLHATHNLVHGDIKSSNILLRPDPDAAVLTDYGLHPLLNTPSNRSSGGGGCLAPEITDMRRLTFKSDVYSLGVVLLELLTGRSPISGTPFDDGNAVDLPRWVHSVVREEWTAEVFDADLVKPGGGVEEEMVAVLQVAMSCVSVVPDARPDSAALLRMLEDISNSGDGRAPEDEP